MKDLNKVMIIGRLGKAPEMRFTPSGSPVTSFTVASGRQWKDPSGENREETEWFSVVVWNKLAEICNQYLDKGSRVYIEGRLQTRSWDDQQTGEKKYRTEVVANDLIILDSRAESGRGAAPVAAALDEDVGTFDDPPAPRQNGGQRPAGRGPAGGRRPVVSEDDIPF